MLEESILIILKLLLNTQIIWLVYKNIEDYHPNKKQKILIVFDNMIANMLNSKKLNPIVTKLFIRQKTKYFFCFYYRILFCCPKRY